MIPFDPLLHGFRFSNGFPSHTILPIVGQWGIGNSDKGLCGGMSFAALDYYHANLPIPQQDTAPTDTTDPLFLYLCRRNLDMADIPWGSIRIWKKTWPGDRFVESIRALPDLVFPCPLLLLWGEGYNPWKTAEDHVIVACGFRDDHAPHRGFKLYNPNYPGEVGELTTDWTNNCFTLSNEEQPVRGILTLSYTPKVPPVVA